MVPYMSIPSNPYPSQPSGYPPSLPIQPPTTTGGSPAEDVNVDPQGIWAKFLSTPGNSASNKEVKMFLEGLMKQFNLLIKRDLDHAKKAADELRKAAEGEDI